MSKAFEVTNTLNNGSKIPLLAFGTVYDSILGGGKELSSDEENNFKESLKAALLVAHYKHIDTAWYYFIEKYIGEVLHELFETKKISRDELFITTKVWPCFWNDPETSVDISLKDLQLDHVDLLLQHWPICLKKVEDSDGKRVAVPKDGKGNIIFDKDGDYLVTYKKLLKIKESGKAKAIGVSNFTIEMLERAIKETGVVPVCNQVEMHPHLPQLDLYNYCKEKGIVIESLAPLGSTGAPNLEIPLLKELAEKYNADPADILINYLISKKIVALPRSMNPDRIKQGYPLLNIDHSDIELLDNFGVENPKRFVTDPWGVDLGFEHWR